MSAGRRSTRTRKSTATQHSMTRQQHYDHDDDDDDDGAATAIPAVASNAGAGSARVTRSQRSNAARKGSQSIHTSSPDNVPAKLYFEPNNADCNEDEVKHMNEALQASLQSYDVESRNFHRQSSRSSSRIGTVHSTSLSPTPLSVKRRRISQIQSASLTHSSIGDDGDAETTVNGIDDVCVKKSKLSVSSSSSIVRLRRYKLVDDDGENNGAKDNNEANTELQRDVNDVNNNARRYPKRRASMVHTNYDEEDYDEDENYEQGESSEEEMKSSEEEMKSSEEEMKSSEEEEDDDDDEQNENDSDDDRKVARERYALRDRSAKPAPTGTPVSSLHSMRLSRSRRQNHQAHNTHLDAVGEAQRNSHIHERAVRAERRAKNTSGESIERSELFDDEHPRRSARTRTIVQRFEPRHFGDDDDDDDDGHRRPLDRQGRAARRSLRCANTAATATATTTTAGGGGNRHRQRRVRGHRARLRSHSHERRARVILSDYASDDSKLSHRYSQRHSRNGGADTSRRCNSMDLLDDIDSDASIPADSRATAASSSSSRYRGSSLADLDPLAVDPSVRWASVGGLNRHIESLKEMVMLPLLYPELFQRFHITPPRGVLFFGPPGTGKTLTARALANSCSDVSQKVSFFMRKGADCLSKWVGEAERQLRLLFDEAYKKRPSIIFFDEIDGLAPVRSSRQDQIHSSIVSTLLALMDGLDDRGQVIVIGATNRIDSIDPALRRPGRFDRELTFSLPSKSARLSILRIHTAKWQTPPQEQFLHQLAERCVGYCGADLKALCTEASLRSIRRNLPHIYKSEKKLAVNINEISIDQCDFDTAMLSLTPASHRSSHTTARNLPHRLKLLLAPQLTALHESIRSIFPLSSLTPSMLAQGANAHAGPIPLRPRVLITASTPGHSQSHACTAVLDILEQHSIFAIDLASLFGDTLSSSPEQNLVRIIAEARRSAPSIVYWAHAQLWWSTATSFMQATLISLLNDIPASAPVLVLASADYQLQELDDELQQLFAANIALRFELHNPRRTECTAFFSTLREPALQSPPATIAEAPPIFAPNLPLNKCPDNQLKTVPICDATASVSTPLSGTLQELPDEHKRALLSLRMFLRALCTRLLIEFRVFAHPVDRAEQPDYYRVVKQPISLDEIRHQLNTRSILSLSEFLSAIDLLVENVRLYFSDAGAVSLSYVNKACQLQDFAMARICRFNPTSAKICENVVASIRAKNTVASLDVSSACPAKSVSPVMIEHQVKTDVDVCASPTPTVALTQDDDMTDDNTLMKMNDTQIDGSASPIEQSQINDECETLVGETEAKQKVVQHDTLYDTDIDKHDIAERIVHDDVASYHTHSAHVNEGDDDDDDGDVNNDNDISGEIKEVQTDEPEVDVELPEPPSQPIVVVDETKLDDALNRLSSCSDGLSVVELELRHLQVWKIVCHFSECFDRTMLPQRLNEFVDSLDVPSSHM